ncbi:hypothetical protein AA12467_0914 [Gluconobacter sphaericus NBRC 12467]|nr:hypothetical protein AA12467_0914 [Gluconobacter sphaericus NBRC 12467]
MEPGEKADRCGSSQASCNDEPAAWWMDAVPESEMFKNTAYDDRTSSCGEIAECCPITCSGNINMKLVNEVKWHPRHDQKIQVVLGTLDNENTQKRP